MPDVDIREEIVPMAIIYGPPDHKPKFFHKRKRKESLKKRIKYCPFCGESILERFHFCPMCGKDLEPVKDPEATIGFCNHCGKDIPMLSSYCPYCGKRVGRMMNA